MKNKKTDFSSIFFVVLVILIIIILSREFKKSLIIEENFEKEKLNNFLSLRK